MDEEAIRLLTEIRDRLPAKPGQETAKASAASAETIAMRKALRAVLEVMDGWIDGARYNHAAMEHRNEGRGDECWRQFTPSDIRNMVNDAAREVGIADFPHPTHPQEENPI